MALTKAKLIELFDSGQLDDYMGGGALGNITADGKVGTTADLTLMTGTGGLVVARTMAEAISIWKFTNPNLLHNPDFRNPVNQRGVSGTGSATGYFYDRWILNSGTVTVNANYLTTNTGAVIEQRIEGNLLAGAIVTVSVMVGGTVYSGTGPFPTSAGAASGALTGWGWATLGYATGGMYVRLSPMAASNVQRVKLELGTVSTLAYDPPMDYGTELAKCQRYFQVIDTIPSGFCISGFGDGTATVRLLYNAPVPFRGPVTASISGILPIVSASGSFTGTDIVSISQALSAQNNSMVTLLCTAFAAVSAGAIYVGYYTGGGRIALSSDL